MGDGFGDVDCFGELVRFAPAFEGSDSRLRTTGGDELALSWSFLSCSWRMVSLLIGFTIRGPLDEGGLKAASAFSSGSGSAVSSAFSLSESFEIREKVSSSNLSSALLWQ